MPELRQALCHDSEAQEGAAVQPLSASGRGSEVCSEVETCLRKQAVIEQRDNTVLSTPYILAIAGRPMTDGAERRDIDACVKPVYAGHVSLPTTEENLGVQQFRRAAQFFKKKGQIDRSAVVCDLEWVWR